MKIKNCPICKKPYVKPKWLQKHIDKYGVLHYKVFITGVHRQKTVLEVL